MNYLVFAGRQFNKLRGHQPKAVNVFLHRCYRYDYIRDHPRFTACDTLVLDSCTSEFIDWWITDGRFPALKHVYVNSTTPFNFHMRFTKANMDKEKPPTFHITEPFRYRFDTFASRTRRIPKLNFLSLEQYRKQYEEMKEQAEKQDSE